MKRLILLTILVATYGCGEAIDTGNPDVDTAVGAGEVAIGTTMGIGGGVLATEENTNLPTKAAGVVISGAGSVITADGIDRIKRASERRKAAASTDDTPVNDDE
jgi:ABC-type Fe3+ transport system substrate-binding protein